MSMSYQRQKETERRILEAARHACALFPPGDIELSERPDLRIKTGAGHIGVEVTELVRSKGENPFPPVQDEDFHKRVVRLAEEDYYRVTHAEPVCALVYFLGDEHCKRENPEGWRRLADRKTGPRLERMARSLAEFVKDHVPGDASLTFKKRERDGQIGIDVLPTGLSVIGISSRAGAWHSGESATLAPLNPEQLYATIKKKDKLLPKYRAEGPDSPVWLLIYSGPSVSRGVPIPRAIYEWKFPFDFDRVLLFSGVDNRVFEIGHL